MKGGIDKRKNLQNSILRTKEKVVWERDLSEPVSPSTQGVEKDIESTANIASVEPSSGISSLFCMILAWVVNALIYT